MHTSKRKDNTTSGGAKSEVAHKWAKWLPHPCRLGDPHRFKAGGKIRSGPLVGKVATSPLPYWGSPPLQSGAQNQKWPTSGQSGYLTPAVSGIPTAAERGQNQKWPTSGQSGYLTPTVSEIPTAAKRGAKSEVAHKWANWLPHPCRIGDPHRFRAGAKSEVAHKWANWLPHPCCIGDPHRFRARGKIRSGPIVGKLATSPLPSRGSPPLQSGGQNQKWPTSGQSGYLTPAVSGIPIAAERGAKSEVAHLWARWIRHPCRIGDPHRFRAGVQNQKWPTSGQRGYLTPAVSGIPTASERGAKSEVAHKWAKWLPHPCRIGDPHRFRAGGKIRSGPQVGKLATSPLPYLGSPPLQSGGQNQKWPTSGQSGCLTPAVSGIPIAAERGAKSEVAHLWARWIRHPCRIGDPHRFRAGGKIRSAPQVGNVATSPLPYLGSPPLQSGGQNQKWPTSGQSGYLTPAVSGIPTAAERGAKSEVAHKWANWLPHPCRIWDPHRFRAGGKIRSGPQVGKVATSPLPYRGSPLLQSGGKIRSGPQVGKLATSPLPSRGSPTLQSGGQKTEVAHKWAKWPPHPCPIGNTHRCRAGAKSEVAQKWAKWLPHPCRIGDPHRCRAGGKIRSGPQVGKVATSPLPYRGSPPLQSEGQNQKWPASGQIGYLTPAVSGIPTASERGAKSEVAHKWAKWLPHPCRIGDPHRCRAGGKIRSGPLVGKVDTSPLPYRGSPPLQSGGQNQKWPTSGQRGYLTPAVSGIPSASERGAKSEVAHKWAKWLPHPCRNGDPHRFRAGGKIRSGPQVGKLATSPLPYLGSPPLQSGGQNQKWPTSGQSGYLTPAVSEIPAASERGAKSEVAHKWANWLPHPCRIWDPHRFRAGRKIRSGRQVGKVATSPLPYRGSSLLQSGGKIRSGPQVGNLATSPLPYLGFPPLQSGGQNQKWPTSGQSGYLTPAVSEIPAASERGAKSEVAHKWANWLPHPCRIRDPHRCRAGGKIRSGPQVGKLATSPLPYLGFPPLQSGGQNQKWPTSGQSGYLTPAVSEIPAASERGAKSEVAHKWAKWPPHPCPIGNPHCCRAGAKSEVAQKWAKWLPHPCRIGDPHCCRAGGKIRSGPQVGKLATSPLPYLGSPPLQSGGQNQKWPTSGQSGYLTPAVSGIPTAAERGQNQKWPTRGQSGYLTPAVSGIPSAAERGAKSEVAHKWANWLPHPCRIWDPHRFKAGGKIRSGPQVGKVATSPLPYRGSRLLQSGGKIRSGPQVGKVATSPLPYRGSPPLQSRGQNQEWPTSGQIGYLTPAISGIPTDAERGAKSEVAHKWAKWLPHPCRIGDPHRCRAGAKSEVAHKWVKWLPHPCRIGDPHRCRAGAKSEVAHKWAKWLPHPAVSGIPTAAERGQNQKWPTSGQSGYLTPAVSGIPTAAERGAKSEVAHEWAKWLPDPWRIGDPHRYRAGGKIRSGPQVGKVATFPDPTAAERGAKSEVAQVGKVATPAVSGIPTAAERGAKSEVAHLWAPAVSPPLQSGDPHRCRAGVQNQKWPTSERGQNQKCGQSGYLYLTPEVAHKWANWLRIGDPHRCRAGRKIRSGPQVGKVDLTPAVSGIPTAAERGHPPPLQSGAQNQKWPTSAAERGAKWAKWLRLPCRIGDPHRCRAGGKIRSGPLVGKVATSPLPYRGSPLLQSGGQNQKWPTSGQSGYLTPAVTGIPTAAERGAKSEVAHEWAKWLPDPWRIGDPHRYRAGGKIRSGPQVGKVATFPLPYWGSPPLQSGGQNQKWPTCGQSGYLTPAVSGIPTAAERGAKSEVAHKWAKWLPHPCRNGDPHRCEAGGKIRSGPQVGKLATSPLPSRGSPLLQSGGQNQKWPTCGQSGYVTPAVSGIPTASERGGKSEVAHKWAKWLPHPCHNGDPHRCEAGGKIRSGPQVGKLATSPLPYRGSPLLQSGGQNQKWPTSGQSGYLTPAVSGIPTAAERGAKSEVAHKWANWLPHPCRIGDPHRFRAGAKSEVARKWVNWLPHPCRIGDPHRFRAGAKSEVAHKWANWLPHPCRIGDPHRCRAGRKIRSGPQVGKVATSPLPYRGSRLLQSGGQNQKWPTSGQSGYLTPAVSGIPTAAERGQNQKWPTSG